MRQKKHPIPYPYRKPRSIVKELGKNGPLTSEEKSTTEIDAEGFKQLF